MPAIKGRFSSLKPLYLLLAALIISAIAILLYARNSTSKDESVSPEYGAREIEKLTRKIEKNPSDIKSIFERGRLRYFMGTSYWIDAASDLETAREKGFLDPMTFFYLGNIYSYLGFYDYAAEELTRYLNNRGPDYKAALALGKTYYLKKDYDKALEVFEKIREDFTSDIVVLENIILTRWRLGMDYSAQLLEMKKMSAAASCRADYLDGYIKSELKQWRESETVIQSAFAANCEYELPDRLEMLKILYRDYIALKDYTSALNALKESRKVGGLDREGEAVMSELEKKISSSGKK